MELAPATYRCAEDGHDLTELVRDQLEEFVPATFARGRSEEFRVIVACPGRRRDHLAGQRFQLRADSGGSRMVLAQAADPVDGDGVGASTIDVPKVAGYSRIEVTTAAAQRRCVATVDLTVGSGWAVVCTGG